MIYTTLKDIKENVSEYWYDVLKNKLGAGYNDEDKISFKIIYELIEYNATLQCLKAVKNDEILNSFIKDCFNLYINHINDKKVIDSFSDYFIAFNKYGEKSFDSLSDKYENDLTNYFSKNVKDRAFAALGTAQHAVKAMFYHSVKEYNVRKIKTDITFGDLQDKQIKLLYNYI